MGVFLIVSNRWKTGWVLCLINSKAHIIIRMSSKNSAGLIYNSQHIWDSVPINLQKMERI